MDTNTPFSVAHAHVCHWEGYFDDDPDDAGGVTKYGVCLEFLKSIGADGDINGDGVVNRKDVLAVTLDNQKELFKKHFWDSANLDDFPPRLAICFYDSAVNTGKKQTVKLLQRALGVSDDGTIGPKTMAAVKSCDDKATALKMCDFRDKFYQSISTKNNNRKFLKGWLNRVEACRKLIKSY